MYSHIRSYNNDVVTFNTMEPLVIPDVVCAAYVCFEFLCTLRPLARFKYENRRQYLPLTTKGAFVVCKDRFALNN